MAPKKIAASPRHGGKKAMKAELLEAGAKLKEKYPKMLQSVGCVLCGIAVPRGALLEHKHRVHGERPVSPSPAQPHDPNLWVSVVGGGLPSLGKRSR